MLLSLHHESAPNQISQMAPGCYTKALISRNHKNKPFVKENSWLKAVVFLTDQESPI